MEAKARWVTSGEMLSRAPGGGKGEEVLLWETKGEVLSFGKKGTIMTLERAVFL